MLGGGTDLGLRVSKDREALPAVIATEAVQELRQITAGADALEIGGAVTYTEALPHLDRHFASFGALVRRIGSRQIRNLGTIAGNLATASPIGDTLPCLIALDATVTLASAAGERALPVESFITGYRKTALAAGEVIAAIRVPYLAPGREFAAYKVSKRFDQDISTVIAAFRLERQAGKVGRLRAAYGGMAARAMRAARVETAMSGRPWTPTWLADIDAVLARDFTPISDHRGSAAYRLRAAAGLLRRFQHETSSTSAGAGGGDMNEMLGRIRGGVHAAVRHDSAIGHVTGAARYLDDIPTVPGTLEAALVLSPHAHARIRHIDLVARARRARRRRRRSPRPTFPARTTSRRSAATSRRSPPTWSNTRASRWWRSRPPRSIRRARRRSSSRSTTSRCPRC